MENPLGVGIETVAKLVLEACHAVFYDAQLVIQTAVAESLETVERSLHVGGENPTGMGTLAIVYVLAGAVTVWGSLHRLR